MKQYAVLFAKDSILKDNYPSYYVVESYPIGDGRPLVKPFMVYEEDEYQTLMRNNKSHLEKGCMPSHKQKDAVMVPNPGLWARMKAGYLK
jgi:hypothetical protein